jgi:NADPH:quinone reductase-like Zn-dependent oxidoreductase
VPAHLKPGTEVYSLKPQFYDGTAAEYSMSSAKSTALKPRTISHTQAASIPLVALTALQAFDIAESHLDGGLKGKTVYIPGGLSGIGSISVQLAKKVFGAAKVITTLSPSKIDKVEGLLGKGIVDQIIDYTKENPAKVLASRSVDFLFDVINDKGSASLHLMKKGGVILSVTSLPFGADLERVAPGLPSPIRWTLDGIGAVKQYRAGRYGVECRSMFVRDSAEDLNRLSEWIDQGLIRPIVGRVSKLDNLNEVREGCLEVFNGKGGTGKFVIEID